MLLTDEDRLVDEGRHDVEQVVRRVLLRGDCLGGVEFEPVGEHRQPTPQLPLVRIAQVVAPVDAHPQRLLAVGRRSTAAREQPEPVGQPFEDLIDRHRPQPCRGEFDRQR